MSIGSSPLDRILLLVNRWSEKAINTHIQNISFSYNSCQQYYFFLPFASTKTSKEAIPEELDITIMIVSHKINTASRQISETFRNSPNVVLRQRASQPLLQELTKYQRRIILASSDKDCQLAVNSKSVLLIAEWYFEQQGRMRNTGRNNVTTDRKSCKVELQLHVEALLVHSELFPWQECEIFHPTTALPFRLPLYGDWCSIWWPDAFHSTQKW